MGSVRIPLHSHKYPGLFAIVDEEDYERLSQHRWHVVVRPTTAYARTTTIVNGRQKNIRLHRMLLDAPAYVEVDHENGDGLDCRKANLRLVTHAQNMWNRRKQSSSTTPYKGISWDKKRKRWRASVTCNGKAYFSKRFRSPIDAARAYDRMAVDHFGEYAWTNFPQLTLF